MRKTLTSLVLLCVTILTNGQIQWIQRANVPDNLGSAVGFAIGSTGYIGLGWNPMAVKNFYKYNPTTNSWSPIAQFPGNNIGYAEGFSINGRGHVAVGQSTSALADVWEYNPVTDS